MELASTYIPIDRRHAIAASQQLPERTQGAALFADISGFTPLTEALERELGPKRGAEELTVHLNRVYDALVAEVHHFGGSVIGFSGDAITCWFEGDDGRRATTSALSMQRTMGQFAEVRTRSGRVISLGMKAAVAVGPVRRFVVGDPEYVLVDVMAGRTLESLADAEHQAERGDVVLDPAAVASLKPHLEIAETRVSQASGAAFAVVTGLALDVPPAPWPPLPDDDLTPEQKQAWLLPPVHRRLVSGQGVFLAELRPAAALFLRFGGINYDADEEAPAKLDLFIRGVSSLLTRYEGSLIQLTIGDKGSYLYAAFGAPIAHEDDAIRAGAAALEIQELAGRLEFLDPLQIGLTLGRMRTGAYGSATRRTYGVLGDNVNLAARLMAASAPGQIFASEPAREAMGDIFNWETLDNIRVKGKTEPIAISRLLSLKKQRRIHLKEPRYALPMVGRTAELALISEKLDQALTGQGQIIAITAEAGMGKSRLAAEVITFAQTRGFEAYAGECQSYGTTTSYLVWQGVWRAFFDLNATDSQEQQVQDVETTLRLLDASLIPRLPLLGPVLNLSLVDNDLTASLDAKLRKTALESLLVSCLQARAGVQPLLIMLEDCHWLDPLSEELIEIAGRALANLPVVLLLVYRPPDAERQQGLKIGHLAYFTEISLEDFTDDEARQLISLKLRKFFGEETAIPPDFVNAITARAAGNPFYIEEILNYLQDLNVDPQDAHALAGVDLPTSIYSLILSRIDQLNERQQITIRVASVIGRLFPAAMVWGIYPEIGALTQVTRDLNVLSDLELTPLDTPEPELTYLFKHVLTQEIAYESLLYATRAMLHEHIGLYIEKTYPDNLDRYVSLLAYHFEHSENEAKKREYLLRAGLAAQQEYANTAAINYFRKVLPLLPVEQQGQTLFELGRVLDTIGSLHEAEQTYRQAMELADQLGDQALHIRCRIEMGDLLRKQSNYGDALALFDSAQVDAEKIDFQAGVGRALHFKASVKFFQGDLEMARQFYEESLAIRRRLNDQRNITKGLINLGAIARSRGSYAEARAYQKEAVAILRQLNDRWPLATALNNLGNVSLDMGHIVDARRYLEEAVAIQREIGHRWFLGNALNNLANVTREQGDFSTAENLYRESVRIYRELNDRWALSYLLEDIGTLAAMRGRGERALRLIGAADTVRGEIKAPLSTVERQKLDEKLAVVRESLNDAAGTHWQAGQALTLEEALEEALA